jgi:hypothetical protein
MESLEIWSLPCFLAERNSYIEIKRTSFRPSIHTPATGGYLGRLTYIFAISTSHFPYKPSLVSGHAISRVQTLRQTGTMRKSTISEKDCSFCVIEVYSIIGQKPRIVSRHIFFLKTYLVRMFVMSGFGGIEAFTRRRHRQRADYELIGTKFRFLRKKCGFCLKDPYPPWQFPLEWSWYKKVGPLKANKAMVNSITIHQAKQVIGEGHYSSYLEDAG